MLSWVWRVARAFSVWGVTYALSSISIPHKIRGCPILPLKRFLFFRFGGRMGFDALSLALLALQ